MSFAKDHDFDVFVSYASVDNHPPVGVSRGWVSNLIIELKRILAEELGHAQGASIWMDYKLAANDPITPTILEALSGSAIILIILSRGYLESRWCARERNAFLENIRAIRKDSRRIFLVEKSGIEWDEKPAEIRDVKGKSFWWRQQESGRLYTLGYPAPQPEEREYYWRIADLAREMASQLRSIRAADARGVAGAEPQQSTEVLLADVTDDLIDQREAVRRYLQQQGLSVIERYYPPDPAEFRQQFLADLARSSLFVQLLSPLTGRRSPGAEDGYPCLQYELAGELGVKILQWYAPGLDVDAMIDGAQKELLQQATVIAEPLEHFKARVAEVARPEAGEQAGDVSASGSDTLIFVNYGREDRELADQVRRVADDLGMDSAVPVASGSPSQVRAVMETFMRESNAMVLLYGEVPETWVINQLLQFRKYRNLDGTKKALAIYEGPPPDAKEISMKLSDMRVIDCRKGVDLAEVRGFLRDCARIPRHD